MSTSRDRGGPASGSDETFAIHVGGSASGKADAFLRTSERSLADVRSCNIVWLSRLTKSTTTRRRRGALLRLLSQAAAWQRLLGMIASPQGVEGMPDQSSRKLKQRLARQISRLCVKPPNHLHRV